MRKATILFLLVLLHANAFAQVPRIDHIRVDERTLQLRLIGSFGLDIGQVSVDSVRLSIQSWTDSIVVCSIPQVGPGHAGLVTLSANGKEDNKMLSYVNANVHYEGFSQEFRVYSLQETCDWLLNFRLDLADTSALQITCGGASSVSGWYSREDYGAYTLSQGHGGGNGLIATATRESSNTLSLAMREFSGTTTVTQLFTHEPKGSSTYSHAPSFAKLVFDKHGFVTGWSQGEMSSTGSTEFPPPLFVARQNELKASLRAFPNPANKSTNLALNQFPFSTATIGIYNVMGIQVKSVPIEHGESSHSHQVNTDDLSSGEYFIQVLTPSGQSTAGRLSIRR